MTTYQPYTYLIGWSKLDRWYYGVRHAKTCNPKDLWVTYFTSSKHVAEFRKLHGEPNVIKIRKIFNDRATSLLWEEKLLKKIKAAQSDRWLNRHNGAKSFYCSKHTEETRLKMSQSAKNISDETRKKRSESAKKMSDDHKRRISESNRTRLISKEARQKMSEAKIGKRKSEETKMKISETLKSKNKKSLDHTFPFL